MVTKKEYILAQLKTKKKFFVRYQVKDNAPGLKNLEIHFSVTGNGAEEQSAIFAFRDVNALVEQKERYKSEGRQSLEDILEGARTGIWTIELEEGCEPRMYADRTMRMLLGVPQEIAPEECYRRWFENIDPDYVDMVQDAVREILDKSIGTGRFPLYPHGPDDASDERVRGGPHHPRPGQGGCAQGAHHCPVGQRI